MTQALEEYAIVRPTADNIAEERRRRDQREGLEKAIESRIKRINELLADVELPEQSLSHIPLRDFLDAMEEILREEEGDLPSGSEPELEADPEKFAGVVAEKRELEERITGLEQEKRDNEDEVRRLEREVTLWRSSYETERQSRDDSGPDPIPAEFASVAHVLEVAEKRFSDRLLFKLNSASDPGHPYKSPYDVWKSLEWLATTYYDARDGSGSDATFDESLRQVSRFHYTPHQSDNTIGMYPDSYYARIEGKKVALKEHMGAGIDHNPNHTIRIAFNWDKELGKVVVGYIGLHQHNRKT